MQSVLIQTYVARSCISVQYEENDPSIYSDSERKLIGVLKPDCSRQASKLSTSAPSISRLVSTYRADSPPTNPGDNGAVREGLGNLNRWSQSTASDKSPPRYAGHHRGSSSISDYDDLNPPKGHASLTKKSPFRHLPQINGISVNASDQLAGNHTTKLYSNARPESDIQPTVSIPNIISARSAHTSAESNSTFASFFHDSLKKGQVLGLNSSELDTPSHNVSPISQAYSKEMAANSLSTEENLSSFADTETYKGKHQRGQSQKTMLSKALQKANTAVLLDNAANFEGAMDAYNDACYLLQLVMLRSNGGEDEKLKLQEIVCLP